MIQWSMKFDMYISDIHYTYTLPRHYDREKYNPEDQKYTTSIHVAYSVLLFYLDCFKTGNCLGSLRVNRVGQLATGVWVVIVYKGYFDGLDSDVDGNVLKKHNTHTYISTFWGFRGAVCIVLVLWIIFILTIEGLPFWSLKYMFLNWWFNTHYKKWVSEMHCSVDWGTMTMIRIVFVVFHLSFVAWSKRGGQCLPIVGPLKGSMCFGDWWMKTKRCSSIGFSTCLIICLILCLIVCWFVGLLLVYWFVGSWARLLAWHQQRCQKTFIPRVHLEYVAISCFGTCLMKMMTMMMTNMTMTNDNDTNIMMIMHM